MTGRSYREAMPLLDERTVGFRPSSKKKADKGAYNATFQMDADDIGGEKEYWEEDFDEEKILFADDKKRGTTLIWNDFAILSVEYLQWVALIQSLAIRWPWPEDWIKSMNWLFAFNLDAWEIAKVASNKTYKSVQDFSSDSSLMPFAYWHFLVALGVLICLLLLAYVVAYIVLSKRDDPYIMVKVANMQRAYIIMFQLLALPVGVALGKIFHCVSDSKGETRVMYVDNTQQCFTDIQWAYAAAAIALIIPFFFVFPTWLIMKTRLELIFSHSAGHEAYLQLKETEYVQGLDVVYIVSGFHVFSSFKLHSAHYRAVHHFFKLLTLICYAAFLNLSFIQAMVMTCVMFIYFLVMAIQRPYRVGLFNIMAAANMFFLVMNLLTGALRTSFDVYSLRSVWFTPSYTISMLMAVNVGWLCFTLCALVYLLLHQFNFFRKPIWPSLTSDGVQKLNEQTKKFMKGVLRARYVVERSMNLPPLFAPAHELSRQIQIINAYCREAEILNDPLQDTLWHLLDELIEVHSQIAPKSLFSESVKDSIRGTASDLMRIMPMFVKRLAQREYDFLLVSPTKRRILLKIYCMGMFLNGRAKKVEMKKLNQAALNKVWNEERVKTVQSVDYLGILQPEREAGPRVGQQATTYSPADVLHDDTLSDDDYLSLTADEDESVDVDMMVTGIPTRSALGSRSAQPTPRASSAVSHDVAGAAALTANDSTHTADDREAALIANL